MDKQFQSKLLCYLLTRKQAVDIIADIDEQLFEWQPYKLILRALKNYLIQYHQRPSKIALRAYMGLNSAKLDISVQHLATIQTAMEMLYMELTDESFVHDFIFQEVKKKRAALLMTKYIDPAALTTADLQKIEKEYGAINQLGQQEAFAFGTDVMAGFSGHWGEQTVGQSSGWPELDSKSRHFGVICPELNVVLKDPKAAGTLFLLNLAKQYSAQGLNVLYLDLENGEVDLHKRICQVYAACSSLELRTGEYNEILKMMFENLLAVGAGEIHIKKMRGRKTTVDDIWRFEEQFIAETGQQHDIMILDYADQAESSNRKAIDRRITSQYTYFDLIAFNQHFGISTWTASKAVAGASKKGYFTLEDAAEDKEKSYNAHNVYGWLATDREREIGDYIRLTCVGGRAIPDHTSGEYVGFQLDRIRQQCKQIPRAEYDELLDEIAMEESGKAVKQADVAKAFQYQTPF